MKYQILQGDNRQTLKTLADNSIDAIVTDPPYGIDFLGKSWDANTGALETYQECLRVLKPGGHILAFSAARTYHHLAVTLEQAGFEIRDQIMWIYSSGFPKSQDIGRQIQKAIYGKPDKQRFDPKIMIKVEGDRYQHPDTGKVYRKLPDINGDRLKKSHEGEGYGVIFEEVLDIKYDKIVDTTKNAGFGQTDHARVRAGEEWSTQAKEVGQVAVIDPQAKAWSGWGTALKPAHEPIALARKPLNSSIKDNCLKYGTGALNIDATRIAIDEQDEKKIAGYGNAEQPGYVFGAGDEQRQETLEQFVVNPAGRFPSNVLGEIADYQKYFYCPKVSRAERHIGFNTDAIPTNPDGMWDVDGSGVQYNANKSGVIDNFAMLSAMNGYFCDQDGTPLPKQTDQGKNVYLPHKGMIFVHGLKHEYAEWCKANGKETGNVGNNHPTVKPIELMKYLIKLITPPNGVVLDPFNGSGSTGCAAVELGFEYIGCELDPAYVKIAEQRIEAWYKHTHQNNFDQLFQSM